MAVLPIDPAGCAYYAEDLGYIQEAGIVPEIQAIQAGSAVIAAIDRSGPFSRMR